MAGWGAKRDWEDSLDTEVSWHLQRLGGAGPGNTQAEGEMMDSVPDISLSPESPAHGLEIPLISLVGSGQQSGGHHSGSSGNDGQCSRHLPV